MKKLWKKNQIIITSLAVLIAVAGYLNYADHTQLVQSTMSGSENETGEDVQKEEEVLSTEEVLNQISEDLSLTDDIESQDQDAEDIDTADSEEDAKSKESDDEEKQAQSSDEAEAAQQAQSADEVEVAQQDDGSESKDGEEVQPGEAVLVNGATSVNLVAQAKLNREQVRASNKEILMEIIDSDSVSEEQKQSAIDQMMEITDAAEKESATENLLSAKGFEQSVVTIQDGKVDVILNLETITDEQRAQVEDIVKRATEIEVENMNISTLKSLDE